MKFIVLCLTITQFTFAHTDRFKPVPIAQLKIDDAIKTYPHCLLKSTSSLLDIICEDEDKLYTKKLLIKVHERGKDLGDNMSIATLALKRKMNEKGFKLSTCFKNEIARTCIFENSEL